MSRARRSGASERAASYRGPRSASPRPARSWPPCATPGRSATTTSPSRLEHRRGDPRLPGLHDRPPRARRRLRGAARVGRVRGRRGRHWSPRTTDEWPVQKYSWRDLTAQPGATYRYEIIPMVGTPGALTRSSTGADHQPGAPHPAALRARAGVLQPRDPVDPAPGPRAAAGPRRRPGRRGAGVARRSAATTRSGCRWRGRSSTASASSWPGRRPRAGAATARSTSWRTPSWSTRSTTRQHVQLLLSNAGSGAGDETNARARARLHATASRSPTGCSERPHRPQQVRGLRRPAGTRARGAYRQHELDQHAACAASRTTR